MKLRFLELDIRVSELQTQRVSVASWEYPVLQALWGNGVSVVNEVLIDRKAPEPEDEFRRLANRYGSPEVDGAPFVAAVYGQFGPGVTALARAIEEGIYEGEVVVMERPAADVPAGSVPTSPRSIEDIEKELEEAKALAARQSEEQKDALPKPLTTEEVETVKAAAPEIAEKIEAIEEGFAAPGPDQDDALAGIV